MKLINDFFDIISSNTDHDSFTYKVKLNPQHRIYRAHFPNNPVTPGVCLVQMSTELINIQYHKNFQLKTAVNIKFKKTITPDIEPSFTFTKAVLTEESLKICVNIGHEDTLLAKMSLLYTTPVHESSKG